MKPWGELTRLGRLRRLHRLARRALAEYRVPVSRVELITEDLNAVYRVRTGSGDGFVLRVGATGPIGHDVGQVRCEVTWLQALASHTDLAVPVPVPSRSGDLITEVSDPGVPDARTCVLFEWLPGRTVDGRITAGSLEAYGRLAAGLHRHAARFRFPQACRPLSYDRVFPFDEPVVLFDDGVLSPARRTLFRAAEQLVSEAIARLRAAEPMRILHGDLHVWNVLVHGGVAAAIDFEDLVMGWPVQDLGIALYYLSLRPGYREMLNAFRRGYEEVAPWPDHTGDEITAFIAGRTLVLANDVELLVRAGDEFDRAGFMERAEWRLREILS